MTDSSVASALRSQARLVVVEAPAGCGKTHQGSDYARDAAMAARQNGDKRVLILAHTHAACDVFASRTREAGSRVEIRTIDSLISQIAGAYHPALGLPPDPSAWARSRGATGYEQLAAKVTALMRKSPMIAHALSQRYPLVICDEHQDSSADQHEIATELHTSGSSLRIFGDPMQSIYGGRSAADIAANAQRWKSLTEAADTFEQLDTPHRWANGADALGRWILDARSRLQNGGQIDLRGRLPVGVRVVVAENQSQRHGGYQLNGNDRRPIDQLAQSANPLLILTPHNRTARSLRPFFNRAIPIWEGHTREALSSLIDAIKSEGGNAPAVAQAAVSFLQNIGSGFSATNYGNLFLAEVSQGCTSRRRGKPATIQGLARLIVAEPNHKGIARFLHGIHDLIETDAAFADILIDHRRELREAMRLDDFDDVEEGFAEISRRRIYARPLPPNRAISTVHKSKGLDCDHVILMPCDSQNFADSRPARCLMYVAISRAKHSLTFVVSRQNASPLLIV